MKMAMKRLSLVYASWEGNMSVPPVSSDEHVTAGEAHLRAVSCLQMDQVGCRARGAGAGAGQRTCARDDEHRPRETRSIPRKGGNSARLSETPFHENVSVLRSNSIAKAHLIPYGGAQLRVKVGYYCGGASEPVRD